MSLPGFRSMLSGTLPAFHMLVKLVLLAHRIIGTTYEKRNPSFFLLSKERSPFTAGLMESVCRFEIWMLRKL